jgi:predicted RNA-binding protein YlqC (UPF0109 family)
MNEEITEVESGKEIAKIAPEISGKASSLTVLLTAIITGLVEQPDDIQITVAQATPTHLNYTLKVGEKETGRVIGKLGRIAKSIRLLFYSAAVAKGLSVSLEIE